MTNTVIPATEAIDRIAWNIAYHKADHLKRFTPSERAAATQALWLLANSLGLDHGAINAAVAKHSATFTPKEPS